MYEEFNQKGIVVIDQAQTRNTSRTHVVNKHGTIDLIKTFVS